MKELENDPHHIELHQHLAPVYNINIAHVEKQINGNYYEYHGSAKEENDTTKNSASKMNFFVNAKLAGEEDMETRKREAARMKKYLVKHHMMERPLTTKQGDSLTEIVVAFVRQWQQRGFVSTPLSGTALVRFLTTDVGLKCGVTIKCLANKIVSFVKSEETSVEIERAVEKTFKEGLL